MLCRLQGPDHPETLATASCLAKFVRKQEKHAEADEIEPGELWVKHERETTEVAFMHCATGETRVQAGEIESAGLVVCTAKTRQFDGIKLWFSK